MRLANLKEKRLGTLYATTSYVCTICCSPDGEAILSSHMDGAIYHYSFQDGAGAAKFANHSAAPLGLGWGQSIAAAGNDCKVLLPPPPLPHPRANRDRNGNLFFRMARLATMTETLCVPYSYLLRIPPPVPSFPTSPFQSFHPLAFVQVTFYTLEGQVQSQFDYSSDSSQKEFTALAFSPSGQSCIVGSFNRCAPTLPLLLLSLFAQSLSSPLSLDPQLARGTSGRGGIRGEGQSACPLSLPHALST